jgi:hypothetical protein
MDWKTFIASVISSLAWPGILAIVFIRYHSEILNLIRSLKTIKAGEVELSFNDEVQELQKIVENLDNNKLDDEKLSKIMEHPREFVLETWIKLENAIRALAASRMDIDHERRNVEYLTEHLFRERLLTKDEYYLIFKLRALRNRAAHLADFEFDTSSVIEYERLTDDISKRILGKKE